jgi:F-type H+-transporting ATPase subunit delta
MLATLIAERYAKALLRAAQAEQALDAVGPQADGLLAAFEAAEGVDRFLADPISEPAAKLAVMASAFEGGPHPILKAFLEAVLAQKRERFLPLILASFSALRDEAEGRTEASFGTARELPSAERKLLETTLSERLKRTVTLKPYTDKSLLGGAVLRVGDTVFDGSLRSRLKRLGRLLAEGEAPRPKRAAPISAVGGAKNKPEAKKPALSAKKKKANAGKASKPKAKKVTAVKKKAAPKKKTTKKA